MCPILVEKFTQKSYSYYLKDLIDNYDGIHKTSINLYQMRLVNNSYTIEEFMRGSYSSILSTCSFLNKMIQTHIDIYRNENDGQHND